MSQSINNMSVSWTDSGTTYKGIQLSVTDTASAAASNLLELRGGAAGTTTLARVLKNGDVRFGAFGTETYSSGFIVTTNTAANAYSGYWGSDKLQVGPALSISWGISNGYAGADVSLFRDAANTLAQRNGTNAQAFRIYNTYTDANNYERGKIAWESNVLRIGTEKLGTGTARALEFQTDGTTRLTIATNGNISTSANISVAADAFAAGSMYAGSTSLIGLNSRLGIYAPADGVARLANWANTDFNRLQFGGTTSSFPALKRNSTTLQARLADDSAFTNIQGKLTADVNAVAETPTATHTITIYDAAGTGYKVLCVAA